MSHSSIEKKRQVGGNVSQGSIYSSISKKDESQLQLVQRLSMLVLLIVFFLGLAFAYRMIVPESVKFCPSTLDMKDQITIS